MHSETCSFCKIAARLSSSSSSIARAKAVGLSPRGHTATQRPQCRQALGAIFSASFWFIRTTAFVAFMTEASSVSTVLPIMAPPKRILPGSSFSPPQAFTRSRTDTPIGTSRFFGSFTAEPSTVTMRSTSGMPVTKYSATLTSEVTLIMMTPREARRWPGPTTLPVALYSSTCLAPWG